MKINKFRQINQNISRGEVFTHPRLVRRILLRVSDKIYLNKKSKFLVPGCGMGVFMIELVKILVEKYNYTIEDAKSRVIGVDNRIKYINYLKRKGYQVYHMDFIKDKLPIKKFDVIIGNPPYNGVNKQEKPWVDFYVKSYSMLKKNGLIMFITPKAWISRPESPKFQPVSRMFTENDLLYVNLNVNKYFSNSGEDIGFQILRKSKTKNIKTEFDNNGDTFELEYKSQKIHLSEHEKIQFSILDKIEKINSKKLSSMFAKRNGSYDIKQVKDGKFSEDKNSEFNVPLLYSMNKKYFIKDRGYELGWKLFFNLSGNYFDVNNEDKYMPILFGYVSGQNTYSVSTPTKEDAVKLRKNYSLNLMRYYIENEKTSGFNSGLPKLPWLGFEKEYTNNDLYMMFDLSEEEIEEVEKYFD